MPIPSPAETHPATDIDVVFSAEQIARRVTELGAEISAYYPKGDLLLLGALKGSFIFLGDLVRRIARPHQVEFIIAASYGKGTTSSGHVRLLYDPESVLEGKHVLIVEDIVDTGLTLDRLVRLLETRDPRSLEICTLLDKHKADGLHLKPRFVGFDAPDAFLVGYGLDYGERFRHLPFVGRLKHHHV